jgi:hypothetical protein
MAGAALATAWIQLQPSFSGVQSAITKEIGGVDVDKAGDAAGQRYSSKFSGAMKVGLAAAATAAVAGVAAVFKTGMEELKFGEQISAQTDQLIKNTGASFDTSFVEDYTLALSQLSGISEEDLQSAGNNVLKFGDVSKDTYERAVASINDLGGAGKDVAGVSEALGKALADPANAMGLLKRQGVILNEEQQALIDNFVAGGDKASAQAVILDQLEATYGGMAEAAGGTLQGTLNKLGNTWENLAGTAVESLMPAITGLVDGLTGFFGWVSENQWVIPVIAVAIGTLLVAAFVAWTASIWAANVALLANPITWIILAIVALIAIIILLVMNWDTVTKFLTEVWQGFVNWFTGVMDAFLGWWNDLWTSVWEWIVSVWNNITGFVERVWSTVLLTFQTIGNAISTWWNGLWQGIWDFLSSIWNFIVAGVTAYFTMLFTAASAIGTAISDWWNGLWQGLSDFFGGIWDGILTVFNNVKGVIEDVIDRITEVITGVKKTFEDVAKGIRDAFDGIGQFIKDAFGPIADFMGGVGQNIANFFGGMGDRARHVKGKLKTAAESGVGGGGAAFARVRSTLPSGLRITDTLSNPARDKALGLVRSANSYHYDANNPAVDIAGPIPLLHQYARQLMAMGGWRQFLWQVPGHYDHIHVAHKGGVVSPSWYRSPGDRPDERTVRLQVGETVLPRNWEAGDVGGGGSAAGALVIHGDVYTTDVDEFFAYAERKKRVAVALAGLEGLEG